MPSKSFIYIYLSKQCLAQGGSLNTMSTDAKRFVNTATDTPIHGKPTHFKEVLPPNISRNFHETFDWR